MQQAQELSCGVNIAAEALASASATLILVVVALVVMRIFRLEINLSVTRKKRTDA